MVELARKAAGEGRISCARLYLYKAEQNGELIGDLGEAVKREILWFARTMYRIATLGGDDE